MRRRTTAILTGALLVLSVSCISITGLASAHGFHSGDSVSLPAGAVQRQTVFAAGRSVDISTEVYGDVFAAGQTVTISGKVHGDVIAAGQTVLVSGAVDGDVRLAGQTVSLSSTVTGNATIAGQSFTLDSRGSIGGDLTAGSADTLLYGRVERDAALGGETVIVGSTVGRNIQAQSSHLRLTSAARVGGTIELTSQEGVQRDSGAVVSGKITRHEPTKQQRNDSRGMFGLGLLWFVYVFLALLFIALALALLFPRMLESVTDQAIPRPWKSLLVGFVAGIVAPVTILVLALTIVGLPLAVLAGFVWLIIIMLSGPVFAYYVGRLLFQGTRNVLLTMLSGASILIVLYFVPILGFLTVLAAIWIGSGMLLLEAFHRTPRPSYRVDAD